MPDRYPVQARIVVALAFCGPLAGCGACEPDRSHPTQGAPSSTALASAAEPSASVRPRLPAGPAPQRRTLPCRAIAVDGDVQLEGGAALARQDEIEPGPWLWLSSDARLVAKDPRTTRETTFRGPGHVKPCVDLAEESWITSGTFESAMGAGETPGAEEWVVTPLGVVRFDAARLSMEVPIRSMHDTVQLDVAEGVAFVWLAHDAAARAFDGGATPSPVDEGWARISGARATLTLTTPGSPPDGARAAIDVCRALGESTRELAKALVGVDADGTTAAAQVRTRRLGRAACAVAAVRVDTVLKSAGKEKLAASLKEADGLWRSPPLLR
ncbi:MAG TPA: hypothetical protein VN894_04210 [Polyangiaceae bacterium]|nr:hypothetical protein [Polyangiaceae bacterium]